MRSANQKPNTAIQTKVLPLNANMLALEPRYVFDAAIATELHDLTHAAIEGHDWTPVVKDTGASIVTAAHELEAIAKSQDGAGTAARDIGVDRILGASQDVVYEAGEARGPAALRVGRP